MKYLCILLFSMISLSVIAQSTGKATKGYVQGAVYEKESKEPVLYASIRLLSRDSTYLQGTATDEKGRFRLSISPDKYILEVSFIGYKPFLQNFNTSATNLNYVLDSIYLSESEIFLKEAVVEAKIPDIVVKGDTIEYNASAYSSQESDMLQDMVKNIPGIEIDANGNITANGKAVTKILVDGKEFFGNDIALALSNLPANMIRKLQLYKEDSETAKITGFKDKDPEQVINLVVKEELKQSIFGDVKAGYGSDDKYANRALVNYMRNENQISFVGGMNNVNNDDHSIGGDNGIDKNKNIGVNASIRTSKKFKIGGNVRYSGNDNLMETKTNNQTFLSTGDRFSKNNSSSHNKRENINMGLNMEWKPDSLTTIFARSYISLNNTKSRNSSSSISYVAEKDTTYGENVSQSKGDGYSLNNYFTIGRKLNDKGRTVSLSFNNSIRKDDSKGSNYSLTTYTGDTPEKIIDQESNTVNKSVSYNISGSYVEPLGKDYRLQLTYSLNNSNSDRERDVRKKDDAGNYTIVDTAYTRNTDNRSLNQVVGLNFQATKEKYRYTLGINIEPSSSRSKVSIGDSIIEDMKQNVVNFSPNINFTYNRNENTSIDFSYNGSTRQPDIRQLSGDTVIVSAMSKYYGNPNLKPSYNNSFNVFYQKSNYETSRFLMIIGGFNYTFNNIVNYAIIDDLGNTTNTYRNVSGNMGANINFMYDTPLKNKKFSINNNSYVNYYKNIGYTNEEKAITHNIVLNQRVTGKFKSEKFETSLLAGFSYNMTRNNLSGTEDRNTSTFNLKHQALLKLPFDFSIQSNLNYTRYGGYGDDFKSSEMLWNASLSKKFLKKKKGTLKIQVFDILNDRNNIMRYVSSNYVSDSRSNTVNRYFLATFTYQFNIIKGQKKQNEEDIYDSYY